MEGSSGYSRRKFIGQSLKALSIAGISGIPDLAWADVGLHKITILHTNDTHSRIDPFPENDPKFAGLGGIARRKELVDRVRDEGGHVLLLDSGDIFQGTPYFNLFGGEAELKAMSQLRYDAATPGNHDFDNGADGLARQMIHAAFPFLNVNYDFRGSALEGKVEAYRVFQKGAIRVGVLGVGIDLRGLVDERLTRNIRYTDPVLAANHAALHLRKEEKCDLVICLSHLGFQYDSDKISDLKLASLSKHIDLILGGHTHTFLDEPHIVKNSEQKNVLVNQVGWGGIRLGRIDFLIEKKTKKIMHSASTVKISKKSS